MRLDDPNLDVQFTQHPRSKCLEAFTVPGMCFDDGTHVRVVEFYNGKKRDMEKELSRQLAGLYVSECDEPDCEFCRPVDED